ncbi:unnamed protein product [Lupinus luteus]|uniref:Taxadien-5-alpha-ol O-acetyltransferase n=1 Tax=Lupinus luteus TaxID=3873 RepID=A0AAV1Y414_LUPLU
MGSSVRIKEAVVVTPSQPTPNCVLPLSALDSQLFLRFTIEYLLVYKPGPGLDRAYTAAHLKAALAKAMVHYYPFAGRVRPGSSGLGLEVACKAQGAVFIEAFSDGYVVTDFEKASKTVTQWRPLLSLHVPDVLKGSPILVVQLTWLRDGGATIGIGINHCISDGIGSANFLNYFAELASRKSNNPKPKPVWDRHLLNPLPQKIKSTNRNIPPEFNRVQDLCGFMNRVTNGLKPTSNVFNKRKLNELKRTALHTCAPNNQHFTSFEVLAAHVWRAWAKSIGFPPNQVLKLLFSVNIRTRFEPDLPKGYYGNAFVLGCGETKAGELVEKGIGYGSNIVKHAKERINSEHVRRVSELVSEWSASPDSIGVLILTQWSRLGLEKVELGMGMGKPVYVGPICCDRYCIFLPVKDERESVRVAVAVPAAAVDDYNRLMNE